MQNTNKASDIDPDLLKLYFNGAKPPGFEDIYKEICDLKELKNSLAIAERDAWDTSLKLDAIRNQLADIEAAVKRNSATIERVYSYIGFVAAFLIVYVVVKLF